MTAHRSTPQSQARDWLRWIARHWSVEDIAQLPVYDDEPYSLGEDAYYHYHHLHETDLYTSEYIYVSTADRTATLTVRWYRDTSGDAYAAADEEVDCPECDYGDVDMAHTARIAAVHRERVAEGVRAALAADEECGADWSGVTVR